MNDQHPKAIEAAQRRAEREGLRQRLNDLKAQHPELRFLTTGRYTICYRVLGRNIIEISTAIRHPNDRDDQLLGKWLAAERWDADECCKVRNPSQHLSAKAFLKDLFFDPCFFNS